MSDPYWSNVVALLHLDGNTTDETGKHIWSTSAFNTTTKKFGSASGGPFDSGVTPFPASDVSSDWAFGTGDFTVECWVYPTAITASTTVYGYMGNLNGTGWMLGQGAIPAASLGWWINTESFASTFLASPAGKVVANTWHHFAYSRTAGTGYLLVNGELVGTKADPTDYTVTAPVSIGRTGPGGSRTRGSIDEVRITKGVGRYTASFTAPTEPFPNTGGGPPTPTVLYTMVSVVT